MERDFPSVRPRRAIFAVGICLALSACENPWLDDAPSLETVLSKGWLFGENEAAETPKTLQPLYCYETIGDGDCYDRPLEDGGNRLVGFDGPAPIIYPEPAKP